MVWAMHIYGLNILLSYSILDWLFTNIIPIKLQDMYSISVKNYIDVAFRHRDKSNKILTLVWSDPSLLSEKSLFGL